MKDRKPCKECPWTNSDTHSERFRGYSDKMQERGYSQGCHMATRDIWGIESPVTGINECAGRKLCGKKR
jgi:hypothetical protein